MSVKDMTQALSDLWNSDEERKKEYIERVRPPSHPPIQKTCMRMLVDTSVHVCMCACGYVIVHGCACVYFACGGEINQADTSLVSVPLLRANRSEK